MRAGDCTRSFLIRAEGGVVVRWACGAELVNAGETAVDVAVLADRYPAAGHHHHHHVRHRSG